MKKIIFLLASFLALKSFGQAPVFADPAIGSVDLTALDDNSINANAITINRVIKLKIPVYNFDQANTIPPGTCKILIGLGSGIIPDPAYNLSAAPLHEYFTWTAMPPQGGQVRVIGTLVAGLPPDFDGLAVFNIMGDKLASSNLSVNFLVTNNNPAYTLSDFLPSNNNASLSYTIVAGALPVDFTDFKAEKKSCNINIQWTTENEVNVNRYEIEMSKDGTSYKTVNTVAARGSTKYAFPFSITAEYEAPLLHFRLKAVDNDGKYLYSNTVVTEGTCKITSHWDLFIFPNPDPGLQSVTITTKTGDFNGRYIINILDNCGRSVSEKELQLDHVRSFPLFIGKIPASKYLIHIANEKESGVIGLIKL